MTGVAQLRLAAAPVFPEQDLREAAEELDRKLRRASIEALIAKASYLAACEGEGDGRASMAQARTRWLGLERYRHALRLHLNQALDELGLAQE